MCKGTMCYIAKRRLAIEYRVDGSSGGNRRSDCHSAHDCQGDTKDRDGKITGEIKGSRETERLTS